MRRFIITLFSVVLTLIVFNKTIYSQDNRTDPISDIVSGILKEEDDIAGITCGDASNEKINKCCSFGKNSADIDIEDPRFFCLPFGGPCASELPIKVFEGFYSKSSFRKQLEDLNNLAAQGEGCVVGTADKPGEEDCICKPTALSTACVRYLGNTDEKGACLECTSADKGVWTGLGCIKVSLQGLVSTVISLGLGLAGITSLLCIIYASFVLQTSAGNPERIKKAREYLTNCIMGLLLIIFSIFILRLIGVDILRIPGFL